MFGVWGLDCVYLQEGVFEIMRFVDHDDGVLLLEMTKTMTVAVIVMMMVTVMAEMIVEVTRNARNDNGDEG